MGIAVSEEAFQRPPSQSAAGPSGTAVRRSVILRPSVAAALEPESPAGLDPDDPFARKIWISVIGAAAVADLLRLIQAARTGKRLLRPRFLHVLLGNELARIDGGKVVVGARVPLPSQHLLARLPSTVRTELSRRTDLKLSRSPALKHQKSHNGARHDLPNQEGASHRSVGPATDDHEGRSRRGKPGKPSGRQ